MAYHGSGSLRERRPGVWEIRVAAGTDPVTGRTMTRSVTFRGDRLAAELYANELAEEYRARRSVAKAAPLLTVTGLLDRWLAADHPWKPSTLIGYQSNAKALGADGVLAPTRVVSLTPRLLRAAFERWTAAGAGPSVVSGRFRALRAAIGWAYDERIIDTHPIRTMRGPARPSPRRPLGIDVLGQLLAAAETQVLEAVANDRGGRGDSERRHIAEQDLLLVRLAADSGARRGELVALQLGDLRGRVLHISRAASADIIGTPKSGRDRTLTIGAATAALWRRLEDEWRIAAQQHLGVWLFSADTDHRTRITTGALGHRFARLARRAGVKGASLHRLRHNVATFLVERGQILQAQARLGHADASTTLREYAYAVPLTDSVVADAIDQHLDSLLSHGGIEQPTGAALVRRKHPS